MKKRDTLESIYELYMNDIYYYLLSLSRKKEVAEDLLHDTFYKAYIYIESFQGGDFKPWLFKIAYNSYIDWYRRAKREYVVDKEFLEGYLTVHLQSAEEQFFVQYEVHKWLSWTDNLNWQQKHALILRDLYDFSYEEIAEQLEISLSSVKIALYRGRQYIKKRLDGEKNELSRRF